jgi:Uncharacterized conserved protein
VTIRLTVQMRTAAEDADRFRDFLLELRTKIRQQEADTSVVYDIFHADGDEFVVTEAYHDSDGLLIHLGNLGASGIDAFKFTVERMIVCGSLSPEAQAVLPRLGAKELLIYPTRLGNR